MLNQLSRICPKPVKTAYWSLRKIGFRIGMIAAPNKTRLFCPCCGLRFRSFTCGRWLRQPDLVDTSRYEHIRQDVLCPYCGSLPRHRILATWLEEHKATLRSSSILYFAPAKSESMWMDGNGVVYTSADLYRDADLRLDIQATGLPDESYDMVICNHVLEHVDDFRAALDEMYRILRPNGSLVCSFPMDPHVELVDEDPHVKSDAERIRRFGQADHQRVFGMEAELFLHEAGFAVERIQGKDCPSEILPIVGPADYDINLLFCCTKSEKS